MNGRKYNDVNVRVLSLPDFIYSDSKLSFGFEASNFSLNSKGETTFTIHQNYRPIVYLISFNPMNE